MKVRGANFVLKNCLMLLSMKPGKYSFRTSVFFGEQNFVYLRKRIADGIGAMKKGVH